MSRLVHLINLYRQKGFKQLSLSLDSKTKKSIWLRCDCKNTTNYRISTFSLLNFSCSKASFRRREKEREESLFYSLTKIDFSKTRTVAWHECVRVVCKDCCYFVGEYFTVMLWEKKMLYTNVRRERRENVENV